MMRRLAPVLTTTLLTAFATAAEIQTLTLKTLNAQMRYDQSELVVKPGEQVKLIFENTDDMPHNLVFFQPGTDVVAICNKQMEKPEEALKRNWLPEDPAMWMHSKLLNPKEKEEIVFKAPEKVGLYPFVCSFPGHAQTMQGKLKVAGEGPKLQSLHFAMYLGDWKNLPDFSKLTPHREGELDGLVEIKLDDYKNQFGVVYTAKLPVPKDGEYTFSVAGDDGVRLLIDGKKVVEYDGIHPSTEIRENKLKLKKGDHDFRLEYFQAAGQAELYAAWAGPDFLNTPLSKWVHPKASEGGKKKKEENTTGMPLAVGDEAVLYRNFITGAGNRDISIGYPGGFNLTWSADYLSPVYLWRGAFLDAARHWINRGGGAQPPLGFDVVRLSADAAPSLAVIAQPDKPWPTLPPEGRAEGFQWKGYTLDKKRFPTFRYEWNGLKVTERFDPAGTALGDDGKIVRTLKIDGQIPAGTLFRIAAGAKVEAADGGFVIDGGKLALGGTNYDNRFKVAAEGATIVDGKALVVPAKAEIKITYSWMTSHAGHAAHAH